MIFAHCALPPSHLDKIQKNSYFFRETVPYLHKMFKMALRLIVMFLHDNDKSDNSTDQHNLSWMLGDCHMGGDEQACLSEQVHRTHHYNRHHYQIIIIITRPKPAYGRQGLAGSWGQDTDEVSTFLVFLTSHFSPAALSSDLTNLGPLMTMEIHLETFKNQGNQPKTMKNHETTFKMMETKQKP